MSLHVGGSRCLSSSYSTEVLPAECGEEHGSREVHGREVVGAGREAGLGQGGLLLNPSQDTQSLVSGGVRQGHLLDDLEGQGGQRGQRESRNKKKLTCKGNYPYPPLLTDDLV